MGALWELSWSSLGALWELVAVAGIEPPHGKYYVERVLLYSHLRFLLECQPGFLNILVLQRQMRAVLNLHQAEVMAGLNESNIPRFLP